MGQAGSMGGIGALGGREVAGGILGRDGEQVVSPGISGVWEGLEG